MGETDEEMNCAFSVVPSIHEEEYPYSPVFSIEELDILYFMTYMPKYYMFNLNNSKHIFFLNYYMLPLGYVPGTAITETPFKNSSDIIAIYGDEYPWCHETYYATYLKSIYCFVSLGRVIYTLPHDTKCVNPYAEIARVHGSGGEAIKAVPEEEDEKNILSPSSSFPSLEEAFKDTTQARHTNNNHQYQEQLSC